MTEHHVLPMFLEFALIMKPWNIRKLEEDEKSCFLPWNNCRNLSLVEHCLSLGIKNNH